MLSRSFVTGSKRCEVATGLLKTQRAVWATTNPLGVLIVLPIVLPKTDRTDLVSTPFVEREAVTARACKTDSGLGRTHDRIGGEFAAVVFKPFLAGVPLRG